MPEMAKPKYIMPTDPKMIKLSKKDAVERNRRRHEVELKKLALDKSVDEELDTKKKEIENDVQEEVKEKEVVKKGRPKKVE